VLGNARSRPDLVAVILTVCIRGVFGGWSPGEDAGIDHLLGGNGSQP
jgi:hypothetical protein